MFSFSVFFIEETGATPALMLKLFAPSRFRYASSKAIEEAAKAVAKEAAEKAAREHEASIPTIMYQPGEPMRNVAIHAGAPDPITRPDSEYPEWVFTLPKKILSLRNDDFLTMEELNKRFEETGVLPTKQELRKANKVQIKIDNKWTAYDPINKKRYEIIE